MKKLFTLFGIALCFFLLSSSSSFGQISVSVTGYTNTTPNLASSYASLSSAITAMNGVTAMSGPVVFNLLAGGTETAPAGGYILGNATLNAVTSATNTITFLKFGAGANPLITAFTPGTSATVDGIWKIQGTDYVTINGISLQENASNTTSAMQMEWGFAIVKLSATDGTQNINITNCSVTLNKANTASVGIYGGNHIATSTTALTIASATGINSNIKINNCTVSNCYIPISISGYTTSSTYYDTGLEIGTTTGNTISNYGGGAVSTSGVYITGQSAPKIENNSITLGTGTTTTAYGINVASACIGYLKINANTISVSSSATTSQLAAISNLAPIATTLDITNNIIQNCTYTTATTGVFAAIYEQAATTGCTVNITGNTITGTSYSNTGVAGSGINYYIYVTTGTPTAVNVNNNNIYSNTRTGSTGGTTYAIYFNKGTTQTANNNNIYNNTHTGTAGTGGSFYGIRSVTGTVVHNSNSIYNNTVTKTTSTGVIYGIYNLASPTNENYNSNTIYGLSTTGTGTVAGIYTNTVAGTRTVSFNNIYNLTSQSAVYGIYQAASSANVFKNKIYGLTGSASSGTVYGIYIVSGTAVNVYNNYVSDLKTPLGNAAIPIAGIYVSGGTTVGLYYNTVFINATSTGALFGVRGIYASTTPTLDMRNNIIVTTSTPTGTGLNVAYMRNSSTLTTYASTSNNNLFYAGTPSASNLLYYDGTNSIQTIGDLKTLMAPRDANSVTELPPFVNVTTAPYDLHLQTTIPTQCESGGSPVSTPIAITDDYDGNTRNVTTPDIGADEGAFTPPAVMTYVSSTTTQVTGYAAIGATNQHVIRIEVVTSGSGTPINVSQIDLNANGTTNIADIDWATAKVYYTGTSSTFSTSTLYGSEVPSTFGFSVMGSQNLAQGTNYFWLAYDISGSASSGNEIDGECTQIVISGSPYIPDVTAPSGSKIIVGPMAGNYYVGQGYSFPNFATITDAFSHLNSRGVSGAVTLTLTNAAGVPYNTANGESFPLTLNVITGASGTNTITMKPNTGVTPIITGASTSSIIKLNQTDYFILDGSNSGGTDRSLTIENSSTAANTTAIWLASGAAAGTGATYNTIKNCNLKTGLNTVTTTYGLYIGGTTVGTVGYDNDNNTIQNNYIYKAYYGIYSNGSVTATSDYLTITQNTIGAPVGTSTDYIWNVGMYILQSPYANISQNTVQNIITTATTPKGIYLYTGSINSTISRNSINNITYTSTGGYGGWGLYVNTGSASSNMLISNNLLYIMGGDGYTSMSNSSPVGMYFDGTTGGLSIYYNSVYMSGNLTYAGATLTAAIYFATSTITGIDLRNNIFQNAMDNASYTTDKNYAIYSTAPASSFTNINYNDYFANGSQGVLGYLGADQTTLAAWQTATTQDANSMNVNPQYNTTTDLRPALGAPILAAGTPVSVTIDYTGITRSGTNPSMGAYENGVDAAPPVITYTALGNTTLTTARTLSTTITDAGSGVPTAGVGLPVLYWKINSGSYTAATGSFISGNTYEFTFGSGVVAGDVVSYYICAQDNYGSPNVTSYPLTGASGFSINPPACSTPPTTPSSYVVLGTISGIKTVGSMGADYATLTSAVNDLNAKQLDGPLTFVLLDATYPSETFPISINPNTGSSATNTVTIKPNTGVNATISGSSASSILKINNGADYITIDGSNSGGTDRSLTIENTNAAATTAGIWLSSAGVGAGATYNTVKNCNIKTGSNSLSTYAVFIGGSTLGTGGSDNDYNTIQNNAISKAYYGIDVWGVSGSTSDYLTITGNTIGSNTATDYVLFYGIYTSYVTNSSLSQNEIYNMKHNGNKYGIYAATGSSYNSYSKNKIHDFEDLDGNASIHTSIGLAFETGLTDNTIDNNVIYKVFARYGTTNNYQNCGIRVIGGTNFKIYYNSVSMTGTLTRGTSGIYSTCLHIYTTATTSMDVRNNIFYNAVVPLTGYTCNNYLMYVTSTSTFTNINYNDYYTTGTNMGYYNGTTCATFAAWQTATTQDANSLNVLPQYTSATDLRPNLGSPVLAAGTPLAGFGTDYLGVSRNGTTPSMGAYENGVDLSGPTITYSLITNTTSTSNRTLSGFATVTDYSGVNTTSGTLPRIYYKKTTDANTFAGNTAFDNGWKWTEATNASTPFDFTIDYSIISGGSVVLGDIIQYFVVAQDLYSTPNVGINSGTFAATPASVDLTSAAFPVTGTINQYKIVGGPLSGIYTVGLSAFNKVTGKNLYYEKLTRTVSNEKKQNNSSTEKSVNTKKQNNVNQDKSADTKKQNIVNNNVKSEKNKSDRTDNSGTVKQESVNQDLTVKSVSDDVIENNSGNTVEQYWQIMENGKPYTGELRVILDNDRTTSTRKGELDAPNGIYATITAAVNDLTDRGVSSAVTLLLVDGTYLTETYPFVLNSVLGVSATNTITIKPATGISPVISGASAGGPIFKIYNTSYVTIDGSNNGTTSRDMSIENTSTTTPQVIWIGSSGTTPITNVTVKNCSIKNGVNSSSAVVISDGNASGTGGYFNNITIQNNTIKQAYIGIYTISVAAAGNGSGTLITGNDLNTSGADAVRLCAIYLQGIDGGTVSNNNIGNNANTVDASNLTGIWFATSTVNSTISGNTVTNISGTSTAPRGIYITSAVANANITITGNNVNTLTSSSTATTIGIAAASTTSGVNITKNRVYDISNTNTSGYTAYGINLASTLTPANINAINNVIYNIYTYGDASFTAWNGYGIYITSGGNYNIYYNSINLTTEQTSAIGVPACINIASGVTGLDIRNNIFQTNQTVGTNRYAIICNSANTAFTNINYNNYYTTGTNIGYIGSDRSNLANWRTGSGQDLFSVSGISGFTSATNLQPDPTSANSWNVNGSAYPIATVTDDYLGNPRNTAVGQGPEDIGAYTVAPSVEPNAVGISGAIVDAGTTTLTFAGTTIATITWHAGAGTLPTSISAVFKPGNTPPGSPYNSYAYEFLEITETGGVLPYTYDLTIYYNLARTYTINISPEDNIRVAKYSGSVWNMLDLNTTTNTTAKTVAITGIDNGFSSFTFTGNDSPLPVNLSGLTSAVSGRDVNLSWKTEREHNNKGFEILRSKHGENNFISVGFVSSKGNSNSSLNYSFNDAKLNSGKYDYKLKQIDLNGHSTYFNLSNFVEVGLPGKFSLSQNYPNPFNPTTKIDFDLPYDSRVSLVIYDMLGREVRTLVSGEFKTAGFYTVSLNATGLSSGTYFYRLIANSQGKDNIFTKKLTIVK